MRTFDKHDVRRLWRMAGLEVLTVERSYGPVSRLTDRLIVVARNGRFGDSGGSPARD